MRASLSTPRFSQHSARLAWLLYSNGRYALEQYSVGTAVQDGNALRAHLFPKAAARSKPYSKQGRASSSKQASSNQGSSPCQGSGFWATAHGLFGPLPEGRVVHDATVVGLLASSAIRSNVYGLMFKSQARGAEHWGLVNS